MSIFSGKTDLRSRVPYGLIYQILSCNLRVEYSLSLWICPLCGKQCSINLYDPSNFEDDILIILLRGLGKGKGFEEVERYSLLKGSDPELLDLISDRVAVIYDLLYEDVEEDEAEEEYSVDLENEEDDESLSELDREILLAEREEEEDEDEDDDEEQVQAMTPLEIELQIEERALQIAERKLQKREEEDSENV